ncbi:hypothetical protein [Alkalihalobacillus sp. TS-13]|uniref:hypothetical protein n=1 Tax=Alkalihalobacillus sp. TS-13 TaxID=2842455 RepID=UPI001C86E129|nr:hypothetical protein [Alkalihalobacillus sp. TS-13]
MIKYYDGSGYVLNTGEDEAKNARYAGARADNGTSYTGSDYAYGNHVYKTSGYEDVIHETYDEW